MKTLKRFIAKWFPFTQPKDKKLPAGVSFLPDLTLHEVLERALLAQMARKIGQALGWDKSASDALFCSAFLQEEPGRGTENERDPGRGEDKEILALAAAFVALLKRGEDAMERIRQTSFPSDCREKLEQIYAQQLAEWRACLSSPLFSAKSDQEPGRSDSDELEWRIYRDVMYAVTQKKFLLIPKQTLPQYFQGRLMCQREIKERSCIPACREVARESLESLGIDPTVIRNWLLLISEAVTNVIKHAREGKMSVIDEEECVRVIVEDRGPGFPLRELPNLVLLAGYSTKKSLGQGFTLMLKMADQVLLATDGEGSALILVFDKRGNDGKS
ncbi:hypothetical protein BSNK01_05370 [Bacillaceae bacterium]